MLLEHQPGELGERGSLGFGDAMDSDAG